MAQKRRLLRVNEHFKPFFNDVLAILVVMLRSRNIFGECYQCYKLFGVNYVWDCWPVC